MEDDVSALMVSRSLKTVQVLPNKVDPWAPDVFSAALHALQTAPSSPEAIRLYRRLERFVKGRVYRTGRHRYRDLLSDSALEDVSSEVLYQLLSGALLRFRGSSLPEMLGFARTIADRTLWRTARRRIRERETLSERKEEIQQWCVPSPRPDQRIIAVPRSPLCDADTHYLLSFLKAGSHATLARTLGVSRAAVTQRVQRIRQRISQLSPDQQATAKSWLRQSAALQRTHTSQLVAV